MKIRTCKREAKETRYWLRLSQPLLEEKPNQEYLIQEVTELMKILALLLKR